MAINWLAKDAARAVQEGKVENLLDIGKRFPLFTILAAQTNEAGLKLIDTLPKYVTARTIEAALKGDAVAADGNDDESTDDAAPASTPAPATNSKPAASKPKADPAPAAKANEASLEGKSPKELYTIAKELGIAVEPKQPAEIYIKAIKKDAQDKAKAAKAAAASKPKADDDWDDDAADAAPAGKAAAKSDDDWDL